MMKGLSIFVVLLMLLLSAAQFDGRDLRESTKSQNVDLPVVRKLKPLKEGDNVFFWRLQKVGSSTLLSILMSYSYRYNFLPKRKSHSNAHCRKIAQCALNNAGSQNIPGNRSELLKHYVDAKVPGYSTGGKQLFSASMKRDDNLSESIPYKISIGHELCNLHEKVVRDNLQCSFQHEDWPEEFNFASKNVKEIFMVRDPLSRAISVYYFWGELFKLATANKTKRSGKNKRRTHSSSSNGNSNRQLSGTSYDADIDQTTADELEEEETASRQLLSTEHSDGDKRTTVDTATAATTRAAHKLGSVGGTDKPVDGKMFRYHGTETTVPPVEFAMDYARILPYYAGMPGPSLSWSAFANNKQHAIDIVNSDRMVTVVVERLDESLVVASHYLGWSLADMVVTKHRKALSSHPKAAQWPPAAVDAIRARLTTMGEYEVYNATMLKLTSSVARLKSQGVDVDSEIKLLSMLQKRVTSICLNDTYLLNYRNDMANQGYPQHSSNNKLRDVEEKYAENGHIFSFNREIICSFDVCGSCEAHAIMVNLGSKTAAEGGKSTFVTDVVKSRKNLDDQPTLSQMDLSLLKDNVDFAKCPKEFPHV